MYRDSSYDEDVAKRLQSGPKAVQSYLVGLTEGDDGLTLEEALKVMIKAMGIKEFCEMTKLSMPNVLAFLAGKRKPKPETLSKYLKPFGLRARLTLVRAS